MGERIFAACLAAFFGFLPYAVKGMPTYVAWIGLVGAVVIAGLTFIPINPKLVLPAAVMIACTVGFVASGAWLYGRYNEGPPPQTETLVRLGALGWTIKSEQDGTLLIQISEQALPAMRETGNLLAQLNKPFRLELMTVPNLNGLHYLANLPQLTNLTIQAGRFTDISELRGFTNLSRLALTQIPFDNPGIVDPAVLSSLANLQELNLSGTRIRSVEPLAALQKLTSLNLGQTSVFDISPISKMASLQKLEIRETRVSDLGPLALNEKLADLTIDDTQVPSVASLAKLPTLKNIMVIEQHPANLSPLGEIESLETLSIIGVPQQFDLLPLQSLPRLRSLQISPFGFGVLSPVSNLQAIGSLHELKTLTLGSLQIDNLNFVSPLKSLEELNLNGMRITSLAPLVDVKSMKRISLVDIPVIDVSPLLQLPQLAKVYLIRVPARADVLTALENKGVVVERH